MRLHRARRRGKSWDGSRAGRDCSPISSACSSSKGTPGGGGWIFRPRRPCELNRKLRVHRAWHLNPISDLHPRPPSNRQRHVGPCSFPRGLVMLHGTGVICILAGSNAKKSGLPVSPVALSSPHEGFHMLRQLIAAASLALIATGVRAQIYATGDSHPAWTPMYPPICRVLRAHFSTADRAAPPASDDTARIQEAL